MTDREIFQLWQDSMQNKVEELDKAIEILNRLRESYSLAASKEFVPETWNDR
jgi:flagellin-specific chaperone FliS